MYLNQINVKSNQIPVLKSIIFRKHDCIIYIHIYMRERERERESTFGSKEHKGASLGQKIH
jgi:hypothetical protein